MYSSDAHLKAQHRKSQPAQNPMSTNHSIMSWQTVNVKPLDADSFPRKSRNLVCCLWDVRPPDS